MKNIIIITTYFLASIAIAFAQSPMTFNYQGVLRDGNTSVANSTVTVEFTILDSNGAEEYKEEQSVGTNDYGMFTATVGGGIPVSGQFSAIDWSGGDFKLRVRVNRGMGFIYMGEQALRSVPFSRYADKAGAVDMALEELTDVSAPALIPGDILKWNGTQWEGDVDNVEDADNDASNEIQTLSLSGNDLSLSNGGGTVTLSSGTNYSAGTGIDISNGTITNNAPDQVVSLSGGGGTSISGTYPNFTISSADLVDDADADPNNEIQQLSKSGSTVTLSNGGGSFTDAVDDADADPVNEIQTISLSGSVLSLSDGGGSVSLPTGTNYSAGTGITISNGTISNGAPDQIVSLNGSGATNISGTYPNFTISSTDLVNDADADPSNEIQTLNKSGNTVSLSNGGGSFTDAVNDADASPTNEIQTLSKSGNTVSLSNGGGSFTDAVNDADASPTNEIQTLSLAGNTLSLNNGGNSVNVSAVGPWSVSGSNIYRNSGNVGIGTSSPQGALHILKSGSPPNSLSSSQNGLMLGINSTSSYKWIQSYGGHLSINSKGNSVGIGTTAPLQKLHVAGKVYSTDAIGIGASNPQGGLHILKTGTPPNSLSSSQNGLVMGIQSTSGYKWIQSYGGHLSINSKGNSVGIGTTAPLQKLHVAGKVYSTDAIGIGASNPQGALHILKAGAPPSGLSSSQNGLLMGINSTSSYKWIQSYGGHLAINTQGNNVGIGTTSPTHKLHVVGQGYASVSWVNGSDRRFKKDIQDLQGALASVMKMQGRTYLLRVDEFPDRNFDEGQKIGFIAQELEEIFPELVTTDSEGYKAVDYAKVTPILVEAIKEQAAQIAQMQQQQQDMQNQLEALSASILTGK